MTREFCEKLQRIFTPHEVRGGYRHWRFNYEQFRVTMLGSGFKKPTLEETTVIAEKTLKRVKSIYVVEMDLLQATEPGDIIIIPGYQRRCQQHVLAITDMDHNGDGRSVLFSTSWHTTYGMTAKQIDRYISFAREFFGIFGRNVQKV